MRKIMCAILPLGLAAGVVSAKDQPLDLGIIDVVGVTPLQSNGVAASKIPANIQTVSSEQLEKSQSITLADYISRYLGSVHINEAQNNPLQPDISYRGFVASPLLGLPQGLSTYVNGVRFNEPFGDTVNWDLIPEGAIDSMALYPGSNPVYGLNSLGGAISIKTKTGFSAPNHELEVYGGSWDRHSEELSSGWNNGTWGYFLDLHHFEEDGWRDFSPTKADQAFGTLSWRGDKGSLDLTLGGNDNNMKGNGAAPIQLQQQNRAAVFTHPDQTVTRMFFSELAGSYDLADDVEVSGNAYFRQNRIQTFNGDNSNYAACAADPTLLCDQDEAIVTDINSNQVLADNSVLGATNNTSQTYMRSRGGTLQTAFAQDLFKHKNNLTVGTSYDYAEVHFGSDTELGSLTDTRGTTQSGIFVDESKVRLHTNSSTVGVFLTDSFSITDDLTATVAGRYNYSHINMEDKYIKDPLKTLDGAHTFERLNPSAGLTYQIRDNLNVYGSYSESARAPTPMELSCADPTAPCKLPNSFVSDPPLQQIVAKSWEGGFRGDLDKLLGKGDLKWNLGYFNTINHNDIIFRRDASSGIISQGYFSNVGKTRRYGIEAATTVNYPQLFSRFDDWHFSTNYTYLNARYMDGFDIQNPLNPAQAIPVVNGDRIPGIPEHIYKANLSVDLWKRVSVGVDGTYSGNKYFRGDEANTTAPLSGYWLFNATAEYKVTKNFAVFGKVNNIFDKNYNSFGVYGQANEVLPGFDDGRFVSPGAPRAGWIGVRLSI
ncbi:TonB-dependent receptor [Methylobacter sp.]|uniref:TonB-dependent receptor n=1 Tax=Methylobacter sp. TaxID=2051955 RepID=UPI00120DA9CD|nr:TonB-dependent receptor [Methylobacter sp.]TAK62182.1 MAG: TonB-dependent receptor [Methylobacter sp.]